MRQKLPEVEHRLALGRRQLGEVAPGEDEVEKSVAVGMSPPIASPRTGCGVSAGFVCSGFRGGAEPTAHPSDLRKHRVLGYLGMATLDERQKSRSTFCLGRTTMVPDRTSQPVNL